MASYKVLKSFTFQGLSGEKGKTVEVTDKEAIRILSEGGFIETKESKAREAKEEAKAKAKTEDTIQVKKEK